jgi:hypothetical protein
MFSGISVLYIDPKLNLRTNTEVKYMPGRIIDMVKSDTHPRTLLAPLLHKAKRTHQDLVNNYYVLFAVLYCWPDRVPGQDSLVAGILLFDKHHQGWIMQVPSNMKFATALAMVILIKFLVGGLRKLFRRSIHSRCPKIQSLKQLCRTRQCGQEPKDMDVIWRAIMDDLHVYDSEGDSFADDVAEISESEV